jgi:hypothetical protein
MHRSQRFHYFIASCSVKMFSTACDSALITSSVSKWRPFSFTFKGPSQASRVGIVVSHVFGQQFPGEEGRLRRCVVVIQWPVLFSPKFRAKSSHIFKQSL